MIDIQLSPTLLADLQETPNLVWSPTLVSSIPTTHTSELAVLPTDTRQEVMKHLPFLIYHPTEQMAQEVRDYLMTTYPGRYLPDPDYDGVQGNPLDNLLHTAALEGTTIFICDAQLSILDCFPPQLP